MPVTDKGFVDKRLAALAGIGAAAVGLAVGELLAFLAGPRSAPLVAVGGVVVDNVPEPVKDFGIQVFGSYDKLALQVGTLVLLGIAAAGVGVTATRRMLAGLVGVAGFGVVGVAAALTRAGARPVWALPSVLGAAASAVALWWLVGHLAGTPSRVAAAAARTGDVSVAAGAPTDAEGEAGQQPMGTTQRRRFLAVVGWGIGGAVVVGVGSRTLAVRGTVASARHAVTLPSPSGSVAVSPSGADVADLRYVTTNEDFYRIDTALVVPRVDPARWTLKIHGRVGRPLTLTFADLLQRPMVERYITLCCVSNPVGGDLVGNARWLGVPVRDLLDEVDPDEHADQVVSRSVDGFTAGTPTKALRDGRDALVAIAMNGEPLPVEHGFPARMVVPGLYGYVSATKWLAELELTTFADFDAYWVPRGWAQLAPVKTQSRIDRPRAGTIAAGRTVVAGVAWAPHRGISKVEVRVDDGRWQEATLASVASVDTWQLWSLPWEAQRGSHTIQVRATDGAGETQPQERSDPSPDGATGWHTVGVTVR